MIKFKLKQLMADKQFETQKRVTIEDVAKGTGVSRHTLSRIANQPKYSTSTDVIDKLCKFFGCEVGDLMEWIQATEE